MEPTNSAERVEAITRLVKQLSADEQKVLYRELNYARLIQKGEKIKNAVKSSGHKPLSMAEIVAECDAIRTKRYNDRKKNSH